MRIKIALSAFLGALLLTTSAWATQSNLVAGNFPTTSPYSGLSLVNNINTAMTTLLSNNAGSSSPSYAISDMFWANTSSNLETFSPNGTNFYPMGAFGNSTWTAASDGVLDDAISSTGSANAYVVTYSPAPAALFTGHVYKFITNFSNTGSATVNFNSLGAVTLKKLGGTNLASGDFGNGLAVACMYDGTYCQVISQLSSSASGGVSSIATTSPVCGGTITSTGTLSLCSQANNTVLANISGSSSSPSATGSPVVTSLGLGTTSSASGNMVHSPSTNAVAIASNGSDGLTVFSDQGVVTAGATGGDQGSGTVNMTGCFVNGVSCAGTSAMTLLHTVNCTSGSPCSSVVFNATYLSSTYNKYVIEFDGLYASSNLASLMIALSTNNGSSYLSANYNYAYTGTTASGNAMSSSASSAGSAYLQNGSPTPYIFVGNSAATTEQGTIKCSNPSSSSSLNCWFDVEGIGIGSGSTPFYVNGFINNTGTSATNAIKIYPSTGTIVGNFHLYGLSGN